MQKFYLSLLILGNCILSSFANTITPTEAVEIASKFQVSNMLSTRSSVGEQTVAKYGSHIYIVNNSNGGWMLVSGDDRLPQMVLGYSIKGNLYPETLPPSIACLLDSYAYGISRLDLNDVVSSVPTRTSESVAPLLGDIAWDQGHPYNDLFPFIELYQDNANAGCVQIAQGMLMYYYKYPTQGKGSHSFVENGQTYSMDFSKSIYQWDLMKPSYSGNDSKESMEAVSKLIYDIAIANEAYFSLLSGSNIHERGMVEYFDYDPSIFMVQSNRCTRQYFEDMMRKSISEGAPVYIQGRNEMQGGHAFLCDGYDNNGYFHYNLGGNTGYFLSNATGYDADQYLFFNIKPNQGGQPRIWIGSEKELYWYSEDNIRCIVRSISSTYLDGTVDVAIALEDNNGKIIYYPKYHSDTLFVDFETIDFDDKVADGEYILYPVYRINDEDWMKICFPEQAADHLILSVKNGIKTYTNTSTGGAIDNGTILIDGIYYTFNDDEAIVTYRNNLYNSYSGDVVIPAEITFEEVVYPVTKIGDFAFQDSHLGKVIIGSNVRTIGYRSFFNTEVGEILYDNEENITELNFQTFCFCHIDKLKIPSGVTSLPTNFTLGGSKILEIPSSVTFMHVNAINNEENRIKDFYVYWTTPAELPEYEKDVDNNFGPLFGDYSAVTLHVPSGCVDMYKNDEIWGVFGTYTDNQAAINSIFGENSEINILIRPDGIMLDSLPVGETAFIYNQQGMLMAKGKAGEFLKVGKGIIIIKVGKIIKKIIL